MVVNGEEMSTVKHVQLSRRLLRLDHQRISRAQINGNEQHSNILDTYSIVFSHLLPRPSPLPPPPEAPQGPNPGPSALSYFCLSFMK